MYPMFFTLNVGCGTVVFTCVVKIYFVILRLCVLYSCLFFLYNAVTYKVTALYKFCFFE